MLVVCEVKTRSDARYGSPLEAITRAQAVPAAAAGHPLAGGPRGAVRRGAHRRDRAGAVTGQGTSRSSMSGGWARWRWPGPTRSPWSGWKAIPWRSRRTSKTGCSGCSWSGCRTRRCGRPGTGSGRDHQQRGAVAAAQDHGRPVPGQPAQAGQRIRSRHRGGHPRGRRRVARGCPRRALPSSANSGSTASCARSAGVLPGGGGRRRAGFARWPWRRPTRPRPPWSPGCGAWRRGPCAGCSAGSGATPRAGAADPVEVLDGGPAAARGRCPRPSRAGGPGRDLADVLGQPTARRAAEICAAGGHHLSLLGPPGAGKTMLAERIPTVLPRARPRGRAGGDLHPLGGGALPAGGPLITEPPFCAPHHTATKAAIVGGGSGIIQPGRGFAGAPRLPVP